MQRHFFIRYKLYHVVFWLLVAVAWYLLRSGDYGTRAMAVQVTLVKVADIALLVYLITYFFVPRLLYKKKYLLFAVVFIALVFTSSILKMIYLGHLLKNPDLYNWSVHFSNRLYDNILPHFFLVFAGVAVKLIYDYSRLQQRMADIAREKAEAELNFLKSQINPHFLFNSLNAVYFLIEKNNTDARKALHKFSEMLRYQLYDMQEGRVAVEKEIMFLKDYTDMQQLRRDEKYEVEFRCGPEVKGFSIEPLLLIPFVENAFKHISHHSAAKNFVHVELARANGHLEFSVENSTDHTRFTGKPGGIGLVNVKKRLELLYPGKYRLDVNDQDNIYRVHLKLEI